MKRICGIILLLATINCASAQPVARIAFGSCSRQSNEDQLWNAVIQLKPDLWVWGGDNIYADTHDMQVMKAKYDQQKNRASYQQLLQTCPVTGTWDDHDYGINDGGKYYSKKAESKVLALEFLGIHANHPVRQREGLYYSYPVSKPPHNVLILNLDTRWFRDTLYKEFYFDSAANRKKYRYLPNPEGDLLGEAQWAWLEAEIKQSKAALIILNSSIQVVAEDHDFEKWSNFPQARKRLFTLLQKHPDKRVLVISGDRHIGEISKIDVPGLPYPLYDITSSGLTHTWSEALNESNRYRVGELVIKKNFGLLEITRSGKQLVVNVTIRGSDGQVFAAHQIHY